VTGPYPAIFLIINERAHLLICDAAAGHAQADQDSGFDRAGYEREVVRQAVTDKLTADWRSYINGIIKSGRISPVG